MGAYAYQDSKLLATTSGTATSGASAAQVPKHSASLWNRYNIDATWGAGLGIIHRSDMFASTSNMVTLPSFTRFDAALFYTVSKNFQMQLNVENIGNRKYYTMALQRPKNLQNKTP